LLTSTQIAAMMAQQNQMFMGAAGYAQQISAQMPPVMQGAGTIGSYGSPRMGPMYPQAPFLPSHQAGFNYGGGGAMGYGLGNRVGGMGVSALGGAGQLAIGAAGLFGGAMFDPLAGGMAGFSAARAAGMGVAGSLGMGAMAAMPPLAIGMMASHAVGSMVTGAQEQSAVNSALGQHAFINPMSRSGRGFSRTDSMAIGSMMREMQALPEMMTSMSELTRILDKVGQMGVMQGARDASEFKRRFKDTVDTLKTVAQVMGSSMEEALPIFQQSRLMGFHSKQSIIQNAVNSQIVGGVTGMSGQQVAALQMQGSQISHAMGGHRASGARGIARIAGEVGMANQLGILSSERITELTGMEGSEGIQALSSTINEAGYRMAQSSLGNAMTLALGETKDGRYTGHMDQDLVRRVRAGEIGKGELIRIARQKSASRTAKISFKAHQKSLRTEMVNQTGVQGIMMELQTILGERGWNNPDALNLVMQRYGVGEHEAEMLIEMGKEMPKVEMELGGAQETEVRRIANQAFMSQNASWDGIKRKIGKKFENVFTEPFKRLGASIGNSIAEGVDSFVDDIFGRYTSQVTAQGADLVLAARLGSKQAASRLSQASKAMGGGMGGGDMRNTSYIGNTLNWLSGSSTVGEQYSSALGGMGLTQSTRGFNAAGTAERMRKSGMTVLSDEVTWGGRYQQMQGMFGLEEREYTGVTDQNRLRGAQFLQEYGAGKALSDRDLAAQMSRAEGAVNTDLIDDLRMTLTGMDGMEGLLERDKGNLEKFQMIRENMGNYAPMQEARVRLGLKPDDASQDTFLLAAAAKKGGLGKYQGMFDIEKLGKALSGKEDPRSLKEIADARKAAINEAASGFGKEEDTVKAILNKGGAQAKFLYGLFAGQVSRNKQGQITGAGGGKDWETLVGIMELREGESLSKEQRAALEARGIYGKEQDELMKNRDQLQSIFNNSHASSVYGWLPGKIGHGVSPTAFARAEDATLAEAQKKLAQDRSRIFGGFRERMGEFEESNAGLMKSGSAGARSALSQLRAYIESEGGTDVGELSATIAGLKGKEKDLLMRQLPGHLGSGVAQVGILSKKYRRAKKKTLGGLGYDEAGLDEMGFEGEAKKQLLSQIKSAAGDDNVSSSEEKKIEQLIARARVEKGLTKGGGEQGTVAPVAKMVENLNQFNTNMTAVTQAVNNLADRLGVAKATPEKNTKEGH